MSSLREMNVCQWRKLINSQSKNFIQANLRMRTQETIFMWNTGIYNGILFSHEKE